MSHYIVLVKQVPDVSQITDNAFDPKTGNLIRTRLPSVINELDAQVGDTVVITFATASLLKALFLQGNMLLVDYKLEFGVFHGEITLGDEFSPDGCRLWDRDTREKLDKDRFRQGLGSVVESYQEVGRRLGITFEL